MTQVQLVDAGWSDAQGDCRRLFEESCHPMWILQGLAVMDVNRAALRHYGYSRQEFLAMSIGDLSRNLPAAGQHRKKDGSCIDVEITSVAVTFAGRPAPLSSVLDVTHRRRMEAQTRYLDLLLATVNDAVVASDETFILTAWNAAAESTYGRRAEEVLGQPDALVFRTDFVGVERAEAIRQLLETGRFHGELTHRRADGRRIHIESRAAALFDSEGKRLGYVSVNRDVTERRYAKETIRALLNEVLTAQEAERGRIARELHDDTAQTLTSLLVGLRAVEESKQLDTALAAASTLRGLVAAALLGVSAWPGGFVPACSTIWGSRKRWSAWPSM